MDAVPLPNWDSPLPQWDRPAIVQPVRAGYPVHARRWTYPGEIHAHLMTGEHAGKWPADWVRGLTKAEAESLHDDDHEGRVKWSYVPTATKFTLPQSTSSCPGGNCPTSTTGYFRPRLFR